MCTRLRNGREYILYIRKKNSGNYCMWGERRNKRGTCSRKGRIFEIRLIRSTKSLKA